MRRALFVLLSLGSLALTRPAHAAPPSDEQPSADAQPEAESSNIVTFEAAEPPASTTAAPAKAKAAAPAQEPPAPAVEPKQPGSETALPAQRDISVGFSLDRGAWMEIPHFQFGIGLLATMRYGATFNSSGVDSLGFSLPFVRPNIHGSAFDNKLRFIVQPELAGPKPRLLDAEVVYQPIDAFGIDVGQYRPHVSRAWNTGIPILSMPGRGTVDDYYHTDRALGLTLFGRPAKGLFEYDVGVFNAGGYNLAGPVDLQPLVTWRFAVNPLGAVPYTQTPAYGKVDKTMFAIGTHGWSDRYTPEQTDPNIKPIERQRVTVGGDVVVMTPRVHMLAEGFGRWQIAKDGLVDVGWGSQAQVGVMVLKNTLELQARAGVLDPGVAKPYQGIWEGGLNWYLHGNHLRAQLHYVCTQNFNDLPGCASHRAELQTQLWF